MLPDALPQLMDTLLRLPLLDAAQLRGLLQHLPNPRATAEEMLRRGWITQNQFSSLFPDPPQRPTPRETMPVVFGDDESLPGADGEDWTLPLIDEEDKADVPPQAKWARPDRTEKERRPEPQTAKPVPVPSGAARTPRIGWDVPVPRVAGGNAARRQESNTGMLPRQWPGWASNGLLMGTLFLGSLYAAIPLFKAISTVPLVTGQESRQANAGDPAGAVDVPPVPQIVPVNNAKQRGDLLNSTGQNAAPAAPVAVPPAAPVTAEPPARAAPPARATVAKPKSTISLYERVRRVVLANKTEETQRLGMGDIAYENVPVDGSIMVGMEVTYAPFFSQNIIKSVRPIYQRADGTRYDGPICGTPTNVRERVVAREGYAIGGASIAAGMGIGDIQLTFMEIGADGLNPNKSYLSKWLGAYGGARATMYLNDGRPVVGIAGMRSSKPDGPAFCMCLVTTGKGALAEADGPGYESSPSTTRTQRDALRINIGQKAAAAR